MNLKRIYVTLVILTLSFAVFRVFLRCVPKTISMFFPSDDLEWDSYFVTVCYSFYWWMFATNALIYVIISQDFRAIYMLFLSDITKTIFS